MMQPRSVMGILLALLLPAMLLAQSSDAAERLVARRNARLALLPAAPAIPAGSEANPIDRFIQAKWKAAGLKTPPPQVADDGAFLRRIYLDVIGRIPTVEEAKAFLADTAADKRTRLIDNLLARNDDYAAHWTSFWEDAIG